MNEKHIASLAREIARFVISQAKGTDLSLIDISRALGEALVIVAAVPLANTFKHAVDELIQPEDEDEEEDEVSDFEYQTSQEKAYAYHRLSSRYPHEIICLIGRGKLQVPLWLRKEIVAKRRRENYEPSSEN